MKLSDLPADLLAERPHLFSSATVPIGAADLAQMRALIAAVEHVIALPAWQEFTMRAAGGGGTAPAKVGAGGTAQNSATTGVFMGYDFHLTEAGPQLIEINSNAGGGLLAALQAERDDVLDAYVAMFRTECPRELKVLAIVDEAPREQYLYPEFFGFQRLFAQHGIRVLICDPAELLLCHGNLWIEETKLDLVYNRLTDFSLTLPAHAVLREAWRQGVAITPNPAIHARYADKRNLIALTDAALLAEWGVAETTRQTLLAGIPRTEQVTNERAEDFWQQRRQLFFKPAAGFGSKGSYRGDKLTRRVFEEILAGNYVAQDFAPPSTVAVNLDGELTELKADIRNYVYRGEVQLVAARLYQGQTTNFRTPGGGFAKVIEA
ncbi:MAG: hypothetical protein Q7J02_04915 [Rhodocyclaceae bacterium]|nr:hypothetical protein [Rhodocyclaceae bacterium]